MIGTSGDIVVSPWGARFCGRQIPCSIGRNGISSNKCEGDGTTPEGVFRILKILFRPDRIAASRIPGGIPIRPMDIWSDDSDDPLYNRKSRLRPDWPYRHERLFRPDPIYDLIIAIDYNWPDPVPNKGSAIFLHSWRKPRFPTEGCIAFDRNDFLWIVERLSPHTRVRVVST